MVMISTQPLIWGTLHAAPVSAAHIRVARKTGSLFCPTIERAIEVWLPIRSRTIFRKNSGTGCHNSLASDGGAHRRQGAERSLMRSRSTASRIVLFLWIDEP